LRLGTHSHLFTFTTDPAFCLLEDTNRFLLIVRYLKKRYAQRPSNTELLARLKEKYSKVFLFDDSDGADSIHCAFMPYVDAYYKKQILTDTKVYLQPTYRRQIFSDYYHKVHGVIDDREVIRPPLDGPAALAKLRIAWNIGVGSYAQPQDQRDESRPAERQSSVPRTAVATERFAPARVGQQLVGCRFIQARFDYKVYPKSIGYQRRLFLKVIRDHQGFQTAYLDKDAYLEDLQRATAVLSPFGYGEICHRDFEAILAGAVLVKPSMDHIDTWPNVYLPNETYLKVAWDGSDLLDVCEPILSGQTPCGEIADNALRVYRDSLSKLDSKVEELVDHFHQRFAS
jgi:hypothetical protein